MKSCIAIWIIAAVVTVGALAMPICMAAQGSSATNPSGHRTYQLIDLGTFGGPNSFVNGTPPPMINNAGAVAGAADTSLPCPFSDPFSDGLIGTNFVWDNGVLVNLGGFPGGCLSLPNSISANGVIVGSGDLDIIDPVSGLPELHGSFLANGQTIDMGTFGGPSSLANMVNNKGQATGGAENTESDPWCFGCLLGLPYPTAWHAFLWENGVLRDIGTLGGPDSFSLAISESGRITGFSFTNDIPNPTTSIPTVAPFLWDRGRMTNIGSLGGTFGIGGAVNNRGQIVGFSDVAGDIANHAFLWEHGRLIDLGTLGGANSSAEWINDAGQVTGTADLADGTHHAFVYRNGRMTDLGTLNGDACSISSHINARGQVIGSSTDCHVRLDAFLWDNGHMIDLSAQVLPGSGFVSLEAVVINDEGDIVGDATLPNGDVHAVVLKPTAGDGTKALRKLTPEEIAAGRNNATLDPYSLTGRQGIVERFSPTERARTMLRQHLRVPAISSTPRE